jgi:GT2 family glycosyltransferase
MENDADYVMLLNNDTLVDGEFLQTLVDVAEADSKIGIVGSLIYYYDKPDKIQYAGGKINWWLGINATYLCDDIDKGQYDKVIDRDYVCYASCLIKKDVVEKIGYLDEYYFFAIEEFDYCTRAKRAGYKTVLQPDSKVWHKWATSYNKMKDYPETKKLIEQKRGWRSYKLWWRLYKTYSPPIWFIIPFLLQLIPGGYTMTLVLKGRWLDIYKGIRYRFKWEKTIQ